LKNGLNVHDEILEACVKQTQLANCCCKEAPFTKGDLVDLSSKNLSLPKGQAHKLSPKFIGLYKILEGYKNDTFHLDILSELKQWGSHPAFYATLLRIHVPNND
jgi:hypothetical protein